MEQLYQNQQSNKPGLSEGETLLHFASQPKGEQVQRVPTGHSDTRVGRSQPSTKVLYHPGILVDASIDAESVSRSRSIGKTGRQVGATPEGKALRSKVNGHGRSKRDGAVNKSPSAESVSARRRFDNRKFSTTR